MTFAEGEVIADRYRLIECLGEGSVGRVFLVWDTIRRDEIVLKVLHPDIVLTNGGFHGISDHLSKICRLHHSHIASVFDYQEIEGHVILCGEYIKGQTLEALLVTDASLDLENLAIQSNRHLWENVEAITEALSDTSNTMPHLGLHPGNLRVNELGQWILTDFGLNALNDPLAVINTARLNRRERYLAPEWFNHSMPPSDSRCDQYGLGILAAECFAKTKLQPSQEIEAILFRMTKADSASRYPNWDPIQAGFSRKQKGSRSRKSRSRRLYVSPSIQYTAAVAIVVALISLFVRWSDEGSRRNEDRFITSMTEARSTLAAVQEQETEILKKLPSVGVVSPVLIEAVASKDNQAMVEQLFHAELLGLAGETEAAAPLVRQALEALQSRTQQLNNLGTALDSLQSIERNLQDGASFTNHPAVSNPLLPRNLQGSINQIRERLISLDYSVAATLARKAENETNTSQVSYIEKLLQLGNEKQHIFRNLLQSSEVPIIEPRDSPSELLLVADRFASEGRHLQAADHAMRAIQLYEQWIEEWSQISSQGNLRVNSLGMRFQLIDELWVSVWETRVYDFSVFVRESGHDPMRLWITWDPTRGITHPVRSVTRYDAKVMCQWLTERERASGCLADDESYRLPTDLEWSHFAGLPPEMGNTPEERGWIDIEHYPWQGSAPRQAQHGNYLTWDSASAENNYGGFMDPWMETSPVGSFPANSFGLFDLGGNVAEWVLDDFRSPKHEGRTTRGGSFLTFSLKNMRTNSRGSKPSGGEDVGFRIVIAKTAHE